MSRRPPPPGGAYLTRDGAGEPPEETRAEAFYYQKQIEAGTRLVVRLLGTGEVRGQLLWFDQTSLGLRRDDGREVMVERSRVKYVWKDEPVAASGVATGTLPTAAARPR